MTLGREVAIAFAPDRGIEADQADRPLTKRSEEGVGRVRRGLPLDVAAPDPDGKRRPRAMRHDEVAMFRRGEAQAVGVEADSDGGEPGNFALGDQVTALVDHHPFSVVFQLRGE